jgi:aspartyl-tRNA(Asn)/glutamyl-tRNA(Gln) amidotransferase subunit A
MEKLYDKSIEELHNLLVTKEITATDLTAETFDRIKETEKDIDAFITLNEEKAMELAKAIDAKGITEENALAGIPIGIKDNIVTKGILTTAASKILSNFDPIYDATVMEKVYSSDLIPVGKLNMDEFAMGSSSENSAYFKKDKKCLGSNQSPWRIVRRVSSSSCRRTSSGFFGKRYGRQYPPTGSI